MPPVLIAPVAMAVAAVIGRVLFALSGSRLWSEAPSILVYMAVSAAAASAPAGALPERTRKYLLGLAVAIIMPSACFLSALYTDAVPLSVLGASENVMRYVGVWLTSADGFPPLTLLLWVCTCLPASLGGYRLGAALGGRG
jgi:uncharacterized membrane protein YoaK (UPF0700 family)